MQSIIIIGNKQFYLASEAAEANRAHFKGCCGRNVRKIPEKKNLSEEHYLFAKEKDGVWEPSTISYNRAKLLLSKEWLDEYIKPKVGENVPEEKYHECPQEIALDEADMFRDNEGNLFKIRMVGERARDKCYFFVRDVSESFALPNLDDVLHHASGSYERGVHFVTFIHTRPTISQLPVDRPGLYLTYRGLLKVIFSSKCGRAESFSDWCLDVLFRATFGSHEEKVDLSANLLSMNVRNLRAVLDCSAASVPAVYLFSLKSKGNNIYKFGCTSNLKRRSAEHSKKYGDIALECFCYIDPKYIFEAETSIKELCLRLGRAAGDPQEKEVVEIFKEDMKMIRDYFKAVGAQYSGCTADLQRELAENIQKCKEMEASMSEAKLSYENELLRRDLELQKVRSDAEIALLKKEAEISEYKIKLLSK